MRARHIGESLVGATFRKTISSAADQLTTSSRAEARPEISEGELNHVQRDYCGRPTRCSRAAPNRSRGWSANLLEARRSFAHGREQDQQAIGHDRRACASKGQSRVILRPGQASTASQPATVALCSDCVVSFTWAHKTSGDKQLPTCSRNCNCSGAERESM